MKTSPVPTNAQLGVVELFQAENGPTLQVKFENETVWLNHEQLSKLFLTDRTSIVKHIQNIYASGELHESTTCAKIAHVQMEVADNALVALTLMIAESNPEEKEMMINVVVNLINNRND